MKDLLFLAQVVVKTLNLEISRRHLAKCAEMKRIVLKCVPHVQHDYFSSFNQLYHCFLALSLPFPSSFLKLPSVGEVCYNWTGVRAIELSTEI